MWNYKLQLQLQLQLYGTVGTHIDSVVALVLGPVEAGHVPDLAPKHDRVPGGALLPHLARLRALGRGGRRLGRLLTTTAAPREQLLPVFPTDSR